MFYLYRGFKKGFDKSREVIVHQDEQYFLWNLGLDFQSELQKVCDGREIKDVLEIRCPEINHTIEVTTSAF